MKVTKFEVEKVLKTLPIGYYFKRDIPVKLTEDSTSWFDPINDEIGISASQIINVCKSLNNSNDLEFSIRCLLYHEISHAILTPSSMRMTNIINVFEDERIETLLSNFYMNVDFKRFVKTVNDFKNESPKSAFEMFYQIVRFRVGQQHFIDRVINIINRFSYINRSTEYTLAYEREIYDLYNDIERQFIQDSLQSQSNSNSSENTQSSSDESMSNNTSLNKSSENTSSENTADSTSSNDTLKNEATENNAGCLTKDEVQKLFSEVVNEYADDVITNDFQQLIMRSSKSTKKNGSAINSYSGVFNARAAIMRDDYKFFVQQNRLGHVSAYSKLHLNLFIDSSGSFSNSEQLVNSIIFSLIKLEKTNPNFSFDLVTCGIGQKLRQKNERRLKCSGCNWLKKDIFDTFKSLQHSQSININIVLFDGYAFTGGPHEEENFGAFNSSNTVIISDKRNKSAITNFCQAAKKVITNDYANELYKAILQNLELLIR